ncbi:MAG: hypothetical protein J2P21_33165 [Chloracidobacterium sp.]|nr:hypothetical protein [Chloracidobacterium sp.]
MKRAYDILLRLYPSDYRSLFSAEMSATFEEAAGERRGHGSAVFASFAFAELAGLLIGAGAEWGAKLTSIICPSNISPSAAAYMLLQKMRPPAVSGGSFYKIIDLVDESGMLLNAHQSEAPDEVIEAQERVLFMLSRLVDAILKREFEKARFYSDQESRERENLRLLREKYETDAWRRACSSDI